MTKSFTNHPLLNCENTMFKINAWRTFLKHLLLFTFFSKMGLNFCMSCSLNLIVQFLLFGKVTLNLATNILHGVWIELNCAFSFFWCAKSCTMITLCSSLDHQEMVSNRIFLHISSPPKLIVHVCMSCGLNENCALLCSFSVQKSISYRMTRSWHMLKDVRSYHGKYVNCGTNVGGML